MLNNKYTLITMEIMHVINNNYKEVNFLFWQSPESISNIPDMKRLFKFSKCY